MIFFNKRIKKLEQDFADMKIKIEYLTELEVRRNNKLVKTYQAQIDRLSSMIDLKE